MVVIFFVFATDILTSISAFETNCCLTDFGDLNWFQMAQPDHRAQWPAGICILGWRRDKQDSEKHRLLPQFGSLGLHWRWR